MPLIQEFRKLRWRSKGSRPAWSVKKSKVSSRFGFKTKGKVAGEMAQAEILAALSEDPSSGPSTSGISLLPRTSASEPLALRHIFT